MAIVALTNQTISTWTQGIFNLKQTLKLAGWTVMSSADNTTYSSTSDIITSAGSSTGGLGRNNAWFRIKSPDGYAEYVFQRGSDDQNFRVIFSGDTLSGGFIGGAPNATTVPTATDGIELKSSGQNLFSSAQSVALPRWHVVADNAAPYTWWCGSWKSTTGTLTEQGGIIHDFLTARTPGDPSGYLSTVMSSNFTTINNINGLNTPGPTQSYHLVCRTSNNSGWTVPEGQTFAIANNSGGTLRTTYQNSVANPLTLKDELLPIAYTVTSDVTNATNFSWKGITTMMRFKSINRPVTSTYSVNSERDRIIFDSISLPWDGSIPLV